MNFDRIGMARALGAALCAAALLRVVPAPAHSDEYFDTRASAHGGRTRMAGPIHVELVTDASSATLYITDHADRPQSTVGGRALLRVPARELRLELVPAGDNGFTARLPSALPRDVTVIAFVKLANLDAQVVRFTPAAAAPARDQENPYDGPHAHH
ncbi:MAG: hypothetical protein AB7O21_19875 [Gammaproteobacteria bacterium]